MKILAALDAGLTGATALTFIHELLKRVDPDAPRMDLLGINALAKAVKVPYPTLKDNPKAFDLTLLGDIISNSLYYGFTATGKASNSLARGFASGALAGVAATILPEHLGLNKNYSNRTKKTTALTIALYTLGGLITSFAYSQTLKKDENSGKQETRKKIKELKGLQKPIKKIRKK
jgi:hypothetical protein